MKVKLFSVDNTFTREVKTRKDILQARKQDKYI